MEDSLVLNRLKYQGSGGKRLKTVETRLTNIKKTLAEVFKPLIQRLENYQVKIGQLNKLNQS